MSVLEAAVGAGDAVEFDVPVAMRDGAVVRANVYRPTSVESAPVLLMRLPYGKHLPPSVPAVDPVHAALRGAVRCGDDLVVQDTRGRCASGAVWDAFDATDTGATTG